MVLRGKLWNIGRSATPWVSNTQLPIQENILSGKFVWIWATHRLPPLIPGLATGITLTRCLVGNSRIPNTSCRMVIVLQNYSQLEGQTFIRSPGIFITGVSYQTILAARPNNLSERPEIHIIKSSPYLFSHSSFAIIREPKLQPSLRAEWRSRKCLAYLWESWQWIHPPRG